MKVILSLILFIFEFTFLNYFLPKVFADSVLDSNYTIDINTIDTNPQPTPRPLPQILGSQSTNGNPTSGSNYTILPSNDSFSFVISQNLVDFGILTSTNPILRTSSFLLSGPKAGSQILGYENHPLLSQTNDMIQNTSCDNGACTPLTAALWVNTLTFGFGYRCDSNQISACDPQFVTPNYYKTFPDSSRTQLPDMIIFQNPGTKSTKAVVGYKVNISGTQKTGGYYNSITYFAIPNF